MPSLTIKLPPQLKKDIAALAEADGRSVSDFIRRHFTSTLAVEKPAKSARKQKGGAK